MITETQIQNLLYEIDMDIDVVLSDEQIFALSKNIFNNQNKIKKILLELK